MHGIDFAGISVCGVYIDTCEHIPMYSSDGLYMPLQVLMLREQQLLLLFPPNLPITISHCQRGLFP